LNSYSSGLVRDFNNSYLKVFSPLLNSLGSKLKEVKLAAKGGLTFYAKTASISASFIQGCYKI
jgi:hypothetical protein